MFSKSQVYQGLKHSCFPKVLTSIAAMPSSSPSLLTQYWAVVSVKGAPFGILDTFQIRLKKRKKRKGSTIRFTPKHCMYYNTDLYQHYILFPSLQNTLVCRHSHTPSYAGRECQSNPSRPFSTDYPHHPLLVWLFAITCRVATICSSIQW